MDRGHMNEEFMMSKLKGLSKEDYNNRLHSGMFWVWYPDATGNYIIDCVEYDDEET